MNQWSYFLPSFLFESSKDSWCICHNFNPIYSTSLNLTIQRIPLEIWVTFSSIFPLSIQRFTMRIISNIWNRCLKPLIQVITMSGFSQRNQIWTIAKPTTTYLKLNLSSFSFYDQVLFILSFQYLFSFYNKRQVMLWEQTVRYLNFQR